jgi:flavin reductase (DIM6/NTAB) family NADH-FMN oxidoreductase RutF
MPKRAVDRGIAHRLLGGSPVAFIGTRYRERPNVMAASWITPISINPPMLAVAISKNCVSHDFIERTGQFSVSIPSLAMAEQLRDSGMVSGQDVDDKFEHLGLKPTAGEALSAPLVAGCLAYLECSVIEAYEAGEEHTVFFAEVAAAQADDRAFDGTWRLEDAAMKPLHHLGGHQYAVLDRRVDVVPGSEENGT